MRLSILGPPGSGKTTQAEAISRRLAIEHIYPGEILRQEAEGSGDTAARIREYLSAGALVPTEVVLEIIDRHLCPPPCDYILDGFPRTLTQAVGFSDLLHTRGEALTAVIYLHIRREEIFTRLLARGRSDDTITTIEERIRLFIEETGPVLSLYRKMGLLAIIPADRSPTEVTQALLAAVKNIAGRI